MLGEFLTFLLLHTPKLKSLRQWLNTMIYGLEILKDLPGYENCKNTQLQEFSNYSDRNYIGFVPESQEFKNARGRWSSRSSPSLWSRSDSLICFIFRYSNKPAKRIGCKAPCLSKEANTGSHRVDGIKLGGYPWVEKATSLLVVVGPGPRLQKLTVECFEEQGNGSEIVHLSRNFPNISRMRILLGKILKEMTLNFTPPCCVSGR